jgi:hypothetical protein
MRSVHMVRLVAAQLLLLELTTPVSATSRPTSDAEGIGAMSTATTSLDTAAVLYTLEAAFNTRDEAGVVTLFTGDAHISDGAVFLDSDGVRDWARAALADSAWLELIDAPDVGPTSGQPSRRPCCGVSTSTLASASADRHSKACAGEFASCGGGHCGTAAKRRDAIVSG